MIIKKHGDLEKDIVKELRHIEGYCQKHDNILRDINLDSTQNFNKEMNHTFLYYEDKNLIGFLYMFAPTSKEAEIQGYILPNYRRQGYFKELLKEAEKELKLWGVEEILFVCEFNESLGEIIEKGFNANYEFTEYSMEYSWESTNLDKTRDFDIRLEEASKDDFHKLVQLSQEIFCETKEEATEFISRALDSKNRIQYKGIYNGEIIALGGVYLEDDEGIIFGIGILPEYRGKGLGKQLVQQLVKNLKLKHKGDILIEVDSNNEVAFSIYKEVGFQVEVAFDYYRKHL